MSDELPGVEQDPTATDAPDAAPEAAPEDTPETPTAPDPESWTGITQGTPEPVSEETPE